MNEMQEKHRHQDPKIKEDVILRLKRVEGQIRGIMKMVQDDVYCHDILNQFASVRSALNGARDLILQGHIQYCVADEMIQDKQKATAELLSIFKKVTK